MNRTNLAARPRPRDGGVNLGVLFAIYLFLMAWIVLWKLNVPWAGGTGHRIIKLVPFLPSAGAGASPPFEVVANFLLFVPFGIYLCHFAPSWAWWRVAGTIAGTSLALEVTQYVLAIGSSDITDLIVNTAGGLAGIGLLAIARRRFQARITTVLTRVCWIGTALALLASGIVISSPVHYARPGGGMGDPPHLVDRAVQLDVGDGG